jgi:hypothetical protein
MACLTAGSVGEAERGIGAIPSCWRGWRSRRDGRRDAAFSDVQCTSRQVPRQAKNHKIWWVRRVEAPTYCGVAGPGGGLVVDGMWTCFRGCWRGLRGRGAGPVSSRARAGRLGPGVGAQPPAGGRGGGIGPLSYADRISRRVSNGERGAGFDLVGDRSMPGSVSHGAPEGAQAVLDT